MYLTAGQQGPDTLTIRIPGNAVEAHHLTPWYCCPGCDKIIPGMLMAAARLDIPAVIAPVSRSAIAGQPGL